MTFDDLPAELRATLRAAGVTDLPADPAIRRGTLGALRTSDPEAWTALAAYALRTAGSVPDAAPMLGLSAPRLFALRSGNPALRAVETRGAGNPTFGTSDAPPPPPPREKTRKNA